MDTSRPGALAGRWLVALIGSVAAVMPAACGSDLDPAVGRWRADPSQAAGNAARFRIDLGLCPGIPSIMTVTLVKGGNGHEVLEVSLPFEPGAGSYRFNRAS